jgi:hypothetical protein
MSRKFVAALAAAITFVCTAALMAQTTRSVVVRFQTHQR